MTTDREKPPERVDVVVVGAGIVGCATAWWLARRGLAVALVEKGRIGCEQSSRNWGFVRQQGRDPAEMPLIMESLRIWRGLAAKLGEDVGFHQGGALYLASSERELAEYEDWLETARTHQLDTRLLAGAEIGNVLAGARGRWLGALHTPSDGRAEPSLAAPAIARAAARAGAHVLEGCAARGIETAAGAVSTVVTERGAIACDGAVCAGGAWSSLFLGRLGVNLPQLKVRASVLRTAPAPEVTQGAVWSADFGLRRRSDGGYTLAHGSRIEHDLGPDTLRHFWAFRPAWRSERKRLRLRLGEHLVAELRTPRRWALDRPSPFEHTRVLEPAPNRRSLDEARAALARDVPALGAIEVVERWAGLIDVTPDALPVISAIPGYEGLLVATGFSGHGFGIGPGAGRLAADLVTGAPPCVDPTPFRYQRLVDGTPLRPAGAV
jgi:glycine/D-amino acid oxidase-like deaminating enzyme